MKCWCGREAEFTDRITLRSFCGECAKSEKTSSRNVHFQYLDTLIELSVGDAVECCQAGDPERNEGTGVILEVSTDLVNGGTPVYPTYRVRLKGGREKWYTEICLKRVH